MNEKQQTFSGGGQCRFLVPRNAQKILTKIWHQFWDKNNGENIYHWNYFQIPQALSEMTLIVINLKFFMKFNTIKVSLIKSATVHSWKKLFLVFKLFLVALTSCFLDGIFQEKLVKNLLQNATNIIFDDSITYILHMYAITRWQILAIWRNCSAE